MDNRQDTMIKALMEQLIQNGPQDMAATFTGLLNLAMQIEREQYLGAARYERTAARTGYANGYKQRK